MENQIEKLYELFNYNNIIQNFRDKFFAMKMNKENKEILFIETSK